MSKGLRTQYENDNGNITKFRFFRRLFMIFCQLNIYGAQNEVYMSRLAEKVVSGLCFNELGSDA